MRRVLAILIVSAFMVLAATALATIVFLAYQCFTIGCELS